MSFNQVGLVGFGQSSAMVAASSHIFLFDEVRPGLVLWLRGLVRARHDETLGLPRGRRVSRERKIVKKPTVKGGVVSGSFTVPRGLRKSVAHFLTGKCNV